MCAPDHDRDPPPPPAPEGRPTPRRSEERWREMMEALPLLVWSSRPDGFCDFLSRQWTEYTGVGERAQLGSGWLASVHPEDRQRAIAAWRAALRGAPYDVDYRLRAADGGYRWFKSRGVAMRDARGAVTRWVGSCTDIDEQRRAQAALVAAGRQKDDFLATLGHELRNPLAPIRTALHLLRRDPAGAARTVQVLDRQVTQLARLVDDLLDVSRITRGRLELHPEPRDLALLVREVAEDHRPVLAAAGLRFVVEVPELAAPVLADSARLVQVVGNLLSNAAKFTSVGGTVTLALAVEGDAAVVTVRDTGHGIAPEVMEHLFEPFYQGERGPGANRSGLGLGLAVARALVEAHGGTLALASGGRDRGTVAVVRLPLTPHVVPAPAPAAARPQGPVRILVVEDNLDAAETLREALLVEGHEVALAHDGPAALVAARAEPPDLVLCDIGLPGGMDGHDVARALRSDPALRGVAMVALSGFATEEDRRRAREAGFDRHLAKPAALEEILRAVAELAPARRR